MKPIHVALVALVLMVGTAVATSALRSAVSAAAKAPAITLDDMVPRQFGGWRELPNSQVQVVNPQTQQLLDKLYSQIVSRTYVNESGYPVMLSVAYGSDQRGELQAHKPEVCYPAQGFSLLSQQPEQVSTAFGSLGVTRLDTQLGNRREPVTYWLTMGGAAANSRLERRLQEIRLTLTGRIPDGLIFRVSSVDADTAHAYATQDAFVRDLLAASSPETRLRLSGLDSKPAQ